MPDFDTRKPQEPDEPSRHRIASIADKLRTLLITTKLRIPSIAHGLRSLLLANKVRISLVGGVLILLVGAVFTVGPSLYSSSGKSSWQPGVLDDAPQSQIVFGSGNSGLWTMNADGSNRSRLLDSFASDAAWSPDGREATLDGTNITVPDEFNAKVPAWEAEARGQLKDLYATLTYCLDTIQVEKWDPHVSPEAIREIKVLRCTETSHDEGFKRHEGDLRPNVGWSMYEKTHRVGNASYGTGEVVITAQHTFGGSAYQTSTATNGRIERIPRQF